MGLNRAARARRGGPIPEARPLERLALVRANGAEAQLTAPIVEAEVAGGAARGQGGDGAGAGGGRREVCREDRDQSSVGDD